MGVVELACTGNIGILDNCIVKQGIVGYGWFVVESIQYHILKDSFGVLDYCDMNCIWMEDNRN